jgi:formylglycine-generating enzyme required for sulfatase activity
MKQIILGLMAMLLIFAATAQPKRAKADVKKEKELVGTFVPIPEQSFTMQDVLEDGTLGPKMEYNLPAFYMLETEVTNKAYNLFLNDLKAQGRTDDYEKACFRSENWYTPNHHNEAARCYYDSFPAYELYPAVNVPYEGAVLFCQWLTEKVGNPEWEYVLPSQLDWTWAASGGMTRAAYSMGEPFLTAADGTPYYHYQHVDDSWITRTDSGFQVVDNQPNTVSTNFIGSDIPYPAKSLRANGYGLYNMCGNVAEMVSNPNMAVGGSWLDPGYDIRIYSIKNYTQPSPQIGFRVIARWVGRKD